MAWIAVDLDGTLAEDGGNILTIGRPIPAMVDRVKGWLTELKDVRIFTARVGLVTDAECLDALAGLPCSELITLCGETILDAPVLQIWHAFQTALIERWCVEHLGQTLPVTATKDFHMLELWDDRCIQVLSNLGQPLTEAILSTSTRGEPSCHACGAPIALGESVALFHKDCDPCRLV